MGALHPAGSGILCARLRTFLNVRTLMAVSKPANHPQFPAPKVGVLLLNLGTPDGTDY